MEETKINVLTSRRHPDLFFDLPDPKKNTMKYTFGLFFLFYPPNFFSLNYSPLLFFLLLLLLSKKIRICKLQTIYL